jgi:hypothetical protein
VITFNLPRPAPFDGSRKINGPFDFPVTASYDAAHSHPGEFMKPARSVLVAIGVCVWLAAGAAQPAAPEVIQSPELEQFLAHAPIVAIKDIGTGVTHSRKATLEMDGTRHAGVFKVIDEKPMIGVQKLDGGAEAAFQDSWRTEVAAYELDKLIGLGLVPTTVERTYESQKGSLQFWVDNIMDEKKRQQTHTKPPDAEDWNEQMAKLVLWDNLIYNTDRNLNHILITASWKMVAIDHSRTFRPFNQLHDTRALTRFSRTLLARIGTLTEPMLKAKLDRYLDPFQIRSILKRRDAIAAIARKLVAEKGEAAVLYQ